MGKGLFIGGTDNLAHAMKAGWIGVDGVARRIKNIYVGVDGVAHLAWTDQLKKVTKRGEYITKQFPSSLSAFTIKEVEDNHCIMASSITNQWGADNMFTHNIWFDDNGNITDYKETYTMDVGENDQSRCWGLAKFNNNIYAFIGACYHSSGHYANCYAFDRNNNILASVRASESDYKLKMIDLEDNMIGLPAYNSNGYTYLGMYRYDNGAINRVWYSCINPEDGRETEACIPIVIPLSNHRFATISKRGHRYNIYDGEIVTNIGIFSYNYDGTNMNVQSVAVHQLPVVLTSCGYVDLGDDYFVIGDRDNALGLHVNADNTIVTTNIVAGNIDENASVRIGKTDTICVSSYVNQSYLDLYYYDKSNNTLSKSSVEKPEEGFSPFMASTFGKNGIIVPKYSGYQILKFE